MTAHVELWFVSLHGWRVDWEWTWPGVSWTGFRVCVVCWFSKLYLCPDPPRPRWAFPEHGWTSSATVFVLFVGGTLCTSSPVGLTRTKCRFSRGGHPVLRWTLHATKGEENILILPNIWRYKMNRDCFSICCWTLLFFLYECLNSTVDFSMWASLAHNDFDRARAGRVGAFLSTNTEPNESHECLASC